MRRADRLFQIVQHLRGGRLVTAHMLGGRLEVSERTIYRDIAGLAAAARASNAVIIRTANMKKIPWGLVVRI